jgi:hypothetical protein
LLEADNGVEQPVEELVHGLQLTSDDSASEREQAAAPREARRMCRHLPGGRLPRIRNRKRQPAEVARTMFSAVHGIISLGLEERMVAVPPEKLRQQLTQFVDAQLTGLGAREERR